MERIIIGSEALKHWYPDFKREPRDIDYAVKTKVKNFPLTEFLEIPILFEYTNEKYLSPDLLLTLKVSHIFWDINWEKHLFDIQFLLKNHKINTELFFKLYDYWNTYHSKNTRSDLKMSAHDFFDNAVACEYNHDWLHSLLNPEPVFTRILKDGEEVEVDETKFNLLSFEDKCNLVQEEVKVMAWERFKNNPYYVAYGKMLKKFIISHAPIWEALFIIENYNILYKPKYNFFKKIEESIFKLQK